MLQLKKYVASTTALKSIGTVSEFVGIGGSYRPSSERNFNDLSKRVTILLVDKEGNSEVVPCGEKVSTDFRGKKITLSELGSLPIFEVPRIDKITKEPIMKINPETGEEEQELAYFIGYAGGGSNLDTVKVTVTEEMVKTPVQLAREVDWSQLIAL